MVVCLKGGVAVRSILEELWYCPQRLVTQLHRSDPLTIYREGRAIGVNLAGYKKYLFQLLCIYNGNSKKYSLPMKF